ncbi:MAG: DoxX family protein [Spirochaetia bacterium]|nr:DoxX family protein [Spirochaetia bacterium]
MDNLIRTLSGLTGKILYSAPLIIFGLFHFLNAKGMAGMVPLPFGIFWVYITGVALVVGGLVIITDYKRLGPMAAFLTGVMIAIFAVTIHLPAVLAAVDEGARVPHLVSFLKDVAIAGAALITAGSYRH